jgi:hypothetical protein
MVGLATAICLAFGGVETAEEDASIPDRLFVSEPQDGGKEGHAPRFAIGAHVGWFEMKDAEDGEMFYGLHARLYFLKIFAVEGSIDFAKQDFLDDDAELTTVPVQLTGLVLLPLGDLPLRPYGLIGLGWYFSEVEYSDGLAGASDDSDSTFGAHLGFGAELLLGKTLMLHADLRYVFIDEPDVDNSSFEDEEFDFFQISIGASLAF